MHTPFVNLAGPIPLPRAQRHRRRAAALGYLSALSDLSASGHKLTAFQQKILSLWKAHKTNPEVPLYTLEIIMGFMTPQRQHQQQGGEPHFYLFPDDNFRRDVTNALKSDEVVSAQEAAQYFRQQLIDGTHYLMRDQHGNPVDLPPDPPVGPLVTWLGREVNRVLKARKKGRRIPGVVGDVDARFKRMFRFPVRHLNLAREPKVALEDDDAAVRQVLNSMAGDLQQIVDWYVQTGPAAAMSARLLDEAADQWVELPVRRQPGAGWGEELDVNRYNWEDARLAAAAWHDEIARRAKSFAAAQAYAARHQAPRAPIHQFENGWYVEELTATDQVADETAALGHCIAHGGYLQRIIAGTERHISFRQPNADGETFRPRYTVHLNHVGNGWSVQQIKGRLNHAPPFIPQGAAQDNALTEEAQVEHCQMLREFLQTVDPHFSAVGDWARCRRILEKADREEAERRRREARGGRGAGRMQDLIDRIPEHDRAGVPVGAGDGEDWE